MIEKVVTIHHLNEHISSAIDDDLSYWLNKTPEERIAAVEYLRKQYDGSTARLQRYARVVQRPTS